MDVILLVVAGDIESASADSNSVVDGDDEGGWRVHKWPAGRRQRGETGPAEQHSNRGVCCQTWCVGRPAICSIIASSSPTVTLSSSGSSRVTHIATTSRSLEVHDSHVSHSWSL